MGIDRGGMIACVWVIKLYFGDSSYCCDVISKNRWIEIIAIFEPNKVQNNHSDLLN